jgi:hypothetical protein
MKEDRSKNKNKKIKNPSKSMSTFMEKTATINID